MPNEIDNYGALENKNFCIGNWSAHDESIWEIKYHPIDVEINKFIIFFNILKLKIKKLN